MRVPLSWLKDFTPLDLPAGKIVDACNGLGLVVEAVDYIGENLDGVVVGHVLDVRPHPNADKVRLADVDLGDSKATQIACGAPNLAKGQKVPVATVGTVLPNGMKIEARKLRGEMSNGMICASDEIGLPAGEERGIMVLPNSLEPGRSFAEAMGIVSDVVFDLEIETNRPDAMCVSGVARDLAAKLGLPFSIPEPVIPETEVPVESLAKIDVQRPDISPRFTVRVIDDVTITASPELISSRLTLAGMRPINNVVDASNYVMLELGQPSHPFDWDKVAGRVLGVRASSGNEQIKTLDGSQRALPEGAPVIVDGEDKVIGVGGIMGGASSEISKDTETVLNEVAVWEPYLINRTSRQMSLRTDASARFEREADRTALDRAQLRFCEILLMTSPDARVASGMIDVDHSTKWPSASEHVELRTARVNAILGTALGDSDVRSCIEPLGFELDGPHNGTFDVVIPPYRTDCEREIDLIEEVGRIHGYENIAKRVPTSPSAARLTPYQQRRRQLRSAMTGKGFTEIWSAALLGPSDFEKADLVAQPIQVTNPVVREESLLRTSLLPGMLRAISYNAARRQNELALFEIGHVFDKPLPGELLPVERENLSIAIYGQGVDARSIVEVARDLGCVLGIGRTGLHAAVRQGLHPTRAVDIVVDDATVGAIGEVDPRILARFDISGRVGWLEVEARVLLDTIDPSRKMKPVSRFPSAEFDLALLVPDRIPAGQITGVLGSVLEGVLEDLVLFDVFRSPQLGADRRSLAYRLRVVAQDHTLSEAETVELRNRAIAAAVESGATLRT